MVGALRGLGADIRNDGADWVVRPRPPTAPAAIDCGLAGTVLRFVPPMAALSRGPVRFDGDPPAHRRPVQQLLDALRSLGVVVDDGGRGGLPFTVLGAGEVAGGPVTIDASASSQFVSALLLSGARFRRGVQISHSGPPVPSQPYLEMTVQELRARGVTVEVGDQRWEVGPGPIAARDVTIEPDLSTAAPFLAAAVATGGQLTIPGWPLKTTQAGGRLRQILPLLGAQVELTGEALTVSGGGEIPGVNLDLRDVSELAPVLAALCALGAARSHLVGLRHVRGHESDRLAAISTEINRLGGDVTECGDGLQISPQPLHGGLFRTYADHRMAQAAAVLGLVTAGVLVEDIGTTTKTHPDFVAAWTAMLR